MSLGGMKKRLGVYMFLTIAFFATIATGLIIYTFSDTKDSEISSNIKLTVEQIANRIEFIDRDFHELADQIASREEIHENFDKEDNHDEVLRELTGFVKPGILAIFIMNSEGKTVVSTDERFEGNNYSFRQYFIDGIKGRDNTDIAVGVTSKELGYYISNPIVDGDNHTTGVIVIKISPVIFGEEIESSLNILEKSIGEVNYLMTDEFGVIIDTNIENLLYGSLNEIKEEDLKFLNVDSRRYENIEIKPVSLDLTNDKFITYSKEIKSTPLSFLITKELTRLTNLSTRDYVILALAIGINALLASVIIVWLFIRELRPLDKISEMTKSLDGESSEGLKAVDPLKEHIERDDDNKEKLTQNQQKELEKRQQAILNILEDVNTEKEKTELLAEDLKKFKLAVAEAKDHIVITDPEGIVIYANKAVELITGFSRKEVIGKKAGAKDTWGGHMKENTYKELWDTIKNKKESFKGIINNTRKNGEKYIAEATISPVLNTKNEVIYFVGIERDITQEREFQEKIQKANLLNESLLKSIGDGVIATDHDGIIIVANREAEKLLGYEHKELVGESVSDTLRLIREDGTEVPKDKRPIIKALSSGKKTSVPMTKSYYYETKDGSKFPVGMTVTPILMENKIIGTVETFRNITQEKSVDKAKTEFVSLASHQLRTPLTSINWFLEMILEDTEGMTDDQKKYLKTAYQSGLKLSRLVSDLLNVSRLETGRLSIVTEDIQVEDLIEELIDEATPLAEKRKVEIKFDKPKEKLPLVKLDKGLIIQVIHNLMTNAIAYSSEKNGEVKISFKREKNNYKLIVEDNGIGIPEHERKNLFNKFFRAENAKQRAADGSGLGLYLVKIIVEESGGMIEYESHENQGTKFIVTIPEKGMTNKKGDRQLEPINKTKNE